MRRHLFDMLSRGVLELFPSTNTARRAGRPPANLFLNILAKKEKCKIKDAEKKKNKRSQKTQSQETESQNVNYKKNIEYPTFTDNTQIFESPTSSSSTQIFESPTFTGITQIIESPTFTDESQKDKNPTNDIQTIDCLALTYSTQEKPSPTLRHANNEHTGSGQAKRRRKNTDYTQTKQIRNTESHRATRQIPVIIQAEQQRNTQAHRLARENPIFRDTEQQRDTQAHREARENPIFRDTEQQRNTHAHRIARENPVFRDIEQRRDTQAHQIAREDPHYSQIERARDTRARQSARCNSINDWDNVKRKYFNNTKEGYNHPCSCCGRLWHKNSVRKLIKHSISTKYNAEFALSVFNLNPCDESAEFCCTCAKYITQGRMPRLAIANGLKFPDIPDVLNELTSMEERLVSPRHVFLKIVRRGQGLGYQHGLSGNVINVPVKINNMVKALPRSINDDNVITVELKRKFCYKHGRKEQVRPEIIRRAAEYLVTCDLFRTYGIELEGSWTNNETEDTVECTCSSPEQESNVDEIPDVNPGGTETLLDENQDLSIVMAPGEGERPISLLFDRHLEELAFIKVHCAIERKYLVNLSHSEVTRSEISRNDRRAVRPDYLFTALKKQQTIAVKNNVTTCLRKKTVRGAPVFACNVLQNNFVDNLVQHDDGYRVLGGIRNSPAHWESEKKKLLAMVRQFGVPTLFLTISAAEVQWIPLLILLSEVVDKKKLTELEAENLPYDTKTRLIQSDPFICATYFEIKLKEIQKTWSCSSGPFLNYKITHFYYRIEFQHRGSPHAHMMLWLDEAPTFVPGDTASARDISKFVDNIISCNSTEVPDELRRLQLHKHTHTCRPTSDRLCRFWNTIFPHG
ncbi:unnamed protein product [Parnassius apollo]|uniref:(apollo) hypothetical protein n=1 Tax=Parnassius apollo TaxID=110799 RepID=A0A8S3Y1L8_PARAO|nr:unnamed protein product [Parnassius apollo]